MRYQSLQDLRADLPEIAQSVESKTGWSLDLERIRLEVVSGGELSRRAALDETRRTGMPSAEPPLSLRRLMGDLKASAYYNRAIAIYLPKEGAILINEQRLGDRSSDAVKSALHHELTHAAQHQKHPKFIEAIDQCVTDYRKWSNHGSDFPQGEPPRKSAESLKQIQARVSLLEAQAQVLQGMYEQELGLHPEVKMGPIDLVLGLTHRFLAGMRHSVGQYAQGEEIFKRIHATNMKEVDTLFKQPKLTDVVFGAEEDAKPR